MRTNKKRQCPKVAKKIAWQSNTDPIKIVDLNLCGEKTRNVFPCIGIGGRPSPGITKKHTKITFTSGEKRVQRHLKNKFK